MDDENKRGIEIFPSDVVLRRFWATWIDVILIQIIVLSLTWMIVPGNSIGTMISGESGRSFADRALLTLGNFVLFTIYAAIAEIFFDATIGKRILGLRVRSADSDPLPFFRYLIRNILKQIEMTIWVLAFLFILRRSRNGKSLGDQFGKTKVVRV